MHNSGLATSTPAAQQVSFLQPVLINSSKCASYLEPAAGRPGHACVHKQEPMATYQPEAGSSDSEKYHLDAPIAAQETSTDVSTALVGVVMDTTQAGQPMLLQQSGPAMWCAVPQVLPQQQQQQQHVTTPQSQHLAASPMMPNGGAAAYTLPSATTFMAQPWQGQYNTFTLAVPQHGTADVREGAPGNASHADVSGAAGAQTAILPLNHPGPPTSELPLYHRFWSKKQSQVLLSPGRLLHIPRNLIEESLNLDAILNSGLNIQIEADGVMQPDTLSATVALYKNSTGHSYYRILGFKQVCRKYQDWALQCWAPVDSVTVRMCIKWPHTDQPAVIRDDVPLPTMRAAKRGSTRKRTAPAAGLPDNANNGNGSDSSSGHDRNVKTQQNASPGDMLTGAVNLSTSATGDVVPASAMGMGQFVSSPQSNTGIRGQPGMHTADSRTAAPSTMPTMHNAGVCMVNENGQQFVMHMPAQMSMAPAVMQQGTGMQMTGGSMAGSTGVVSFQPQWMNLQQHAPDQATQLTMVPQDAAAGPSTGVMQYVSVPPQMSTLQMQPASSSGAGTGMYQVFHQPQIQQSSMAPASQAPAVTGVVTSSSPAPAVTGVVTSSSPAPAVTGVVTSSPTPAREPARMPTSEPARMGTDGGSYTLQQGPAPQSVAVPPPAPQQQQQQQYALVQTPTGLVMVPVLSAGSSTAAMASPSNAAVWSMPQQQGVGSVQVQQGGWATPQLVQVSGQNQIVMPSQPQQVLVMQQQSSPMQQRQRLQPQQHMAAAYTLVQQDAAGYDQATVVGGFMQPMQQHQGMPQAMFLQQQQQQQH